MKSAPPPPVAAQNPYAAPLAPVSDTVGPQAPPQPADRAQRLAAAIVDGIAFGVPFGVLFGVSYLGSHSHTVGWSIEMFAGALSLSMLVLLGVLVLDLIWLYRYGQSIGKRWLQIRIARCDGSRCGLLRIIFLRSLPLAIVAWALTIWAFLPGLNFLPRLVDVLFVFRADRRCIHDHIADTVVVKA